ncbi:hypothetical protein [Martelella mangrovi]|uniref:Uncharacterized protein n=1 Tax=Martelella mangrovi TaxID=1397477 RepID=A0ABV2IFK8_9HYPH
MTDRPSDIHPGDLLKLLHGRFSSLIVCFNEQHASSYTDAQGWHDNYGFYSGNEDDQISWVSEEERMRAIAHNSVWTIQWYPDTPVGSITVGASTFEVAAAHVLRFSHDD